MAPSNELVMIQGETRTPVLEVTSDGCRPINLTGATDLSISFLKSDGVGKLTLTSTLRTFLSAAVILAANTLTIPAHGLVNGDRTQLTTTGVLPAGLALATDYLVLVVDQDTIQFTDTSGNSITLTDVGSGTASLTLATASLSDAVQGLVSLSFSKAALLAMKPMVKGTAYLSYTIAGVTRLVLFDKTFTVIDPTASGACGC